MISVCMATYNGEKFLKDQIDSILCQIGENDELIISDDGSSDGTLKIITDYKDKRIQLIKNNQHCYTLNFENALKRAKGDIIFLADQDDIWHKNKITVIRKYLEQYDFVMSNARIVDENLSVIVESRNDYLHIKNGFWRNLMKTYYLGCCMAFRREVLQMALPFPKNRKLCFHDSWITMIAEYNFKTIVCDEVLIDYRRHGKNVSSGAMGITSSISRMLKIRGYLLKETLKRAKMRKK